MKKLYILLLSIATLLFYFLSFSVNNTKRIIEKEKQEITNFGYDERNKIHLLTDEISSGKWTKIPFKRAIGNYRFHWFSDMDSIYVEYRNQRMEIKNKKNMSSNFLRKSDRFIFVRFDKEGKYKFNLLK